VVTGELVRDTEHVGHDALELQPAAEHFALGDDDNSPSDGLDSFTSLAVVPLVGRRRMMLVAVVLERAHHQPPTHVEAREEDAAIVADDDLRFWRGESSIHTPEPRPAFLRGLGQRAGQRDQLTRLCDTAVSGEPTKDVLDRRDAGQSESKHGVQGGEGVGSGQ
jgi:hypothetical protein